MRTQIRIIGIGHNGCRLLDGMMACRLREELVTDVFPAVAEIRYIAVETNIDTLGCSSADVGFYVGSGFSTDSGPEALERMAAQIKGIVEHVIHGAHLILLLTGLNDPLECVAAAALAELGQAKNILTLSLVSLPSVDARRSNAVAADLARIEASSDAVYVFPADDCASLGNTCFSPEEAIPTPAGNLINCANVLAKFLCQPHGRRVGFDFQDLRTALIGWDEAFPAYPEQAIQSRHRYLRWVTSLDTPPAELAAAAIASLPLKSAATVLMYIEGALRFSMPHIRNYVIPIVAEAPSNTFIKYFVEVDPGMPEDALAINLYVRTDHPTPGPASHAPFDHKE